MIQIWTLAKRELSSFFNSLMAYILLVLFLGFSGFFTWLYGADIFLINQASLMSFFNIAYWTLFLFIPALTMRLLAEENRSRTIELLLTKPISEWQVVVGKFLSTVVLICIALALTLPYYITVANIGNIDHGAVISGYFGLVLMSAAYTSIGMWASSVSKDQIAAFLIALTISTFFHIIFGVLSSSLTGFLASLFSYLSFSTHFDSISRGVIDSKDIIFFLSIIILGLTAAEARLSKKTA